MPPVTPERKTKHQNIANEMEGLRKTLSKLEDLQAYLCGHPAKTQDPEGVRVTSSLGNFLDEFPKDICDASSRIQKVIEGLEAGLLQG